MTKKEFEQYVLECSNIAVQNGDEILKPLNLSITIDWEYEFDEENWIAVYEGGSVFGGNIIISINMACLYDYFKKAVANHPWSDPYTIIDEAVQTSVYHELGHGIVEQLNDYLTETDELDDLYDANKELFDYVLDNEEDAVERFAWGMYDNNSEDTELYKIIKLYLNLYENTNMGKQVIRLTESDLHRIVKESLESILGEKIEIKPQNKGKFTATKERTGKTTEELTHSKNPLTRKRAIFAQNAKRWSKKK